MINTNHENDERTKRLNELHTVKKCETCWNLRAGNNKCCIDNMVHDPGALECEQHKTITDNRRK